MSTLGACPARAETRRKGTSGVVLQLLAAYLALAFLVHTCYAPTGLVFALRGGHSASTGCEVQLTVQSAPHLTQRARVGSETACRSFAATAPDANRRNLKSAVIGRLDRIKDSLQQLAKAARAEPEHYFFEIPDPSLYAEVPRTYLELPKDKWVGAGWEILAVSLNRAGRDVTLNLMLDSGLTSSMLPPHVARFLGLALSEDGNEKTFMAADGQQRGGTATLQNVSLHGRDLSLGSYSALVANFPQSALGASLGCPIDGMLGMEFYERFGVEIDKEVVRLYEADEAEEVAMRKQMAILKTASLPARLHGVSVAAVMGLPTLSVSPWVLGILDTGSAHTVLSWSAAEKLLGITESPADCGFINAMDISGKPISMPVVNSTLRLSGAGGGMGKGPVVDFAQVEVAIGDIALFAKMVGNTSMPTALVGQDLFSQRPHLFAAKQHLLCFK
mmetsp:Transcript_54504/g.127345  ORF Transcript_54504/g.127345 Transcript_54504/m.127345 type:complete len:446 (-) Transcript_54504:2-1339(-)